MSLADKKSDPSFTEALKEINSLGQTSGFEVATGTTTVKGTPLIIAQLNVLIYQTTSLHQKVDKLETRLRNLEAAKGLDYSNQLEKLTTDLGKLSLGKEPQKPKVKQSSKYFYFKDPKAILEEEKKKLRR